jgi:hypothetical protein
MTLYNYNQMKEVFGEDDEQVKKIDAFIKLIGDCPENRQLEAFCRIEQPDAFPITVVERETLNNLNRKSKQAIWDYIQAHFPKSYMVAHPDNYYFFSKRDLLESFSIKENWKSYELQGRRLLIG